MSVLNSQTDQIQQCGARSYLTLCFTSFVCFCLVKLLLEVAWFTSSILCDALAAINKNKHSKFTEFYFITLLLAASKWNSDVYQNCLLQSMMIWKCLPGFLYQTEDEGKRARQRRDRERTCVRGRALQRERWMASAIK